MGEGVIGMRWSVIGRGFWIEVGRWWREQGGKEVGLPGTITREGTGVGSREQGVEAEGGRMGKRERAGGGGKISENLRTLAKELKMIEVMRITPSDAPSRLYEPKKLVEHVKEEYWVCDHIRFFHEKYAAPVIIAPIKISNPNPGIIPPPPSSSLFSTVSVMVISSE